jgi:general secretion pathway protein J
MKPNGFTPSRRSAEHGFTLVELMVSLLIFGMLAAAGVSLLSFSVKAQDAADARLGELAAVRRAGALLAGDLAQAAPRVSRDEAGATRPAFVGASAALAFVRRGWENVEEARRPSLQKVEYRLAHGRLERLSYPLVDGAAPRRPVTMLEGVHSLALRYRDKQGRWRDRWDPTRIDELPRAVEMVIDVEGSGRLRQLFLAGAAS